MFSPERKETIRIQILLHSLPLSRSSRATPSHLHFFFTNFLRRAVLCFSVQRPAGLITEKRVGSAHGRMAPLRPCEGDAAHGTPTPAPAPATPTFPLFFAHSPLTRGIITLQGVPADKWKTEPVNKDFRVCATYPEVLTVPASASQEMIEQVGGLVACPPLSFLPHLYSLPLNDPATPACSTRLPRFGVKGACPHCATCTKRRKQA